MIHQLRNQINHYFVGKEELVENALTCLLAGGHFLLEDVPGVGKTTLARVLAACISADFGRIQFTPDTLPGDVLGVSVFDMEKKEFTYHEGGIMRQIVLADEINRTSPKTQAGLLEAMAEKQITVDGQKHPLPELFLVIATQNPVEYLGTYPLPEAQMDRFMMQLSIGYPSREAELEMARLHLSGEMSETIEPVCSWQDIVKMQQEVKKVHVSDAVLEYIRNIVELTREDKRFVTGVSPRAFLALLDASMAKAYLAERDFVKPDDVKAVVLPVLHHRLTLTPQERMKGEPMDKVLRSLVISAKIPMERTQNA